MPQVPSYQATKLQIISKIKFPNKLALGNFSIAKANNPYWILFKNNLSAGKISLLNK
jgi:hypothetical protein